MREGALKQEEEKILLIKCSKDSKEKIEAYFVKSHPYEIPEMLWMHPEDVNDAYKQWVKGSHTANKKTDKASDKKHEKSANKKVEKKIDKKSE